MGHLAIPAGLKGLVNWRRLDEGLTTSGQPTEAHLAVLAQMGVRHVVNLALHSHPQALTDEAATVRGLGMAYRHIPVAFDAPKRSDYEAFCEAMAAIGEEPVHIHCIMNYRVSAFIYLWRQQVQGWRMAAAQAEMDSLWRPGGVWAALIGHVEEAAEAHRIAGVDYPPPERAS